MRLPVPRAVAIGGAIATAVVLAVAAIFGLLGNTGPGAARGAAARAGAPGSGAANATRGTGPGILSADGFDPVPTGVSIAP